MDYLTAATAPDWLSAVGTVMGALATACAVVVALFKEPLVEWLWPPRLRLEGDVSPFDVGTRNQGSYETHGYVRLLVRAEPGRAATEVRFYLVETEKAASLGASKESKVSRFGIPLRWAFTHQDAVTLAPDAPRYLDLLEIRGTDPARARLAITPSPKERYSLAQTDSPHRLYLVMTASNKPSSTVRVEVDLREWDGKAGSLERAVSVDLDKKTL